MNDVYYNPEQFDLKVVAEIDLSDGDYQFDLRVVWRHLPTGRLLTARDSGCSCPSPFEDYHSIDDLEVMNLDEIVREIRTESEHTTADERARFLRAVRRAATRTAV